MVEPYVEPPKEVEGVWHSQRKLNGKDKKLLLIRNETLSCVLVVVSESRLSDRLVTRVDLLMVTQKSS